MEQKDSNKLLISLVAVSVIISLGSMLFAFVSYRKVVALESPRGEQPSTTPVDLGPVSFDGFAGKPVSTTVTSVDGKKVVELRGHTLKNPTSSYEDVPSSDTTKRKIVIDSNTRLFNIKTSSKKAPVVSAVTFDQFTTASTSVIYIASYRAGEGVALTETTPATTVAMFSK